MSIQQIGSTVFWAVLVLGLTTVIYTTIQLRLMNRVRPWLLRCRPAAGEVTHETFMRLMDLHMAFLSTHGLREMRRRGDAFIAAVKEAYQIESLSP